METGHDGNNGTNRFLIELTVWSIFFFVICEMDKGNHRVRFIHGTRTPPNSKEVGVFFLYI